MKFLPWAAKINLRVKGFGKFFFHGTELNKNFKLRAQLLDEYQEVRSAKI